jgi:hypothetical protein
MRHTHVLSLCETNFASAASHARKNTTTNHHHPPTMTKLLSPSKTVIAVPARLTPEQCWAEIAPAGAGGGG